MVYNLEPIDRVIDKVIRDLGMGQQEIPFSDFIEWAADALNHIGSYYQYRLLACNILIEDYQGRLPSDHHKTVRMINGCSIKPRGESGFYGGTISNALFEAGFNISDLSAFDQQIIRTVGISRVDNQFSNDEAVPFNYLFQNLNLVDPQIDSFTDIDYKVEHNRVTTAFKDGFIRLQYLALPVDDRGWPLVPDDVSFRDALFWKIAYHVSMRDPACLKNPRMQDMEYCRQMWSKYCNQARAAANMPTLEQTERFANNWLSLFNVLDHQSNGYRDIGKKGNIDFNGRY